MVVLINQKLLFFILFIKNHLTENKNSEKLYFNYITITPIITNNKFFNETINTNNKQINYFILIKK